MSGSNFVFNISKGKVNGLIERVKSNIVAASEINVSLFKVIEADATLEDYDTLAALIAGSNTEADFTNYARKQLDDAALPTLLGPDDTNNWLQSVIGDQVFTAAGGTLDNTLVKLIIGYDPLGTNVNANIIPMTGHTFDITTNGGDLTADEGANGFFRAA